jgi:phage gp29-like protein
VNGDLRLVDVVPVAFERLTFGADGSLRILTEESPHEGIALPPHKFIVHTPHAVSGHAMRGGLLRASAIAYLGKHLAMKDWMVFAELFGMPVRVARYEPSATAEEKRELIKMLESLRSDAAGIFSKAVELQLLEAGHGKTPPPYENICEFFNRELSKAWLGATLTVETTGAGLERSSGGPSIHNEVRLDLRQDDIACEGRTIRRDVLGPLSRLRFGESVPVPYFRRQLELPRDRRELSEVLGRAVNDLRMRVPARWAHETLGIPMAGEGDEVLTGKLRDA